jgi:tRNA dimethylallyltransferase
MKHLIVIGGATATGKTALAIRLAQLYHTEILSADSRQFFQGMDIGTAKASEAELAAVPHHFIDHLPITAAYSVGDFEREALAVLHTLFQKHDVAILVGGSGLYLKAICEGLDTFPDVSAATIAHVEKNEAEGGLPWMQQTLATLDPDYAKTVDLQNPARLRRALEVCLETGLPYSSFRKNTQVHRPFNPIYLLLDLPRPTLYARIDARVDLMIAQGLEAEARTLLPYRDKSALKTVGYEEFFQYFDGDISLADTISKIKQHSRNYAKRQTTWFKKHGTWTVFHPEDFRKMMFFLKSSLELK